MIRFLIHRPISVFVVFFAAALLALLALRKIPVSLLPAIDVPTLSVVVVERDLSAQSIDQQILRVLRRNLSQINGLESLDSESRSGEGVIHLHFDYGRDMQYAYLEVNEWVDRSMEAFDKTVQRPLVLRSSADEIPVFYLSLLNEKPQDDGGFFQFSEYVQERIRPRLEQLEEVSFVDINGTTQTEVVLRFDPLLLQSLRLSEAEIQSAIHASNLSYGSIKMQERALEFNVKIGRPLSSIEDIRNIRVVAGDRILRLQDLALIQLEEQHSTGKYFYNGQRGLSLAIYKSHAAQMDEIFESVHREIEIFNDEMEGLHVQLLKDQTQLLQYSISNLESSLIYGCILAIAIVFLFYRDWRIPLLIGAMVPISVLLSLLFYYLLDLSINLISLSGLILGLGLMIDNGIIVLDNIVQRRDRGSEELATVVGTNEMIRPLLSSMLTTCSVFVPLVFLSGFSAAIFYDQALAISIGLVISFIVSITLLPTLYYQLFADKPRDLGFMERQYHKWYVKGHHFTMKYKVFSFGFVGLVISAAYFTLPLLKLSALPALPEFGRYYHIQSDLSLDHDHYFERLDKPIRNYTTAPSYYDIQVGQTDYLLNLSQTGETSNAVVYVRFDSEEALDHFDEYFYAAMKREYPKSHITPQAERSAFQLIFPSKQPSLEMRLYSHLDTEAALIEEFEEFKRFAQSKDNRLSGNLTRPIIGPSLSQYLVFHEDGDGMARFDVSAHQVLSALKKSLNKEEILTLNVFHRELPIVIKPVHLSLEALYQEAVVTKADGQEIPLKYLIKQREESRLKTVKADHRGHYISINLDSNDIPSTIDQISQYANMRPNLLIHFTGTYFSNQTRVKELITVLIIALLLLYFITAAQFESLRYPLILLSEIPITLSCAIIGIYLIGQPLNTMHIIGMIVSIGIIINDSIIKIDTVQQLRKRGYSINKALELGGKMRLNSILMTSLTSVLTMVVFFTDNGLGNKLQQPLATAVIISLLVGTAVSLFWIPLFYKTLSKS